MILSSASSTAKRSLESPKNQPVYRNYRVQTHVNLVPTMARHLLR